MNSKLFDHVSVQTRVTITQCTILNLNQKNKKIWPVSLIKNSGSFRVRKKDLAEGLQSH